MNDSEIIKALEYCISDNDNHCTGCVALKNGIDCALEYSIILDLINRQKAEIERLLEKQTPKKNDISIIPTRCKCCGQELELIGKYQEALSNLCGVDYSYMKGHKDVDAIVELITFVTLAFEMKETINRQQIEIERLEEEVKDYAKMTTWLTEERDKRDKEIEELKKELETAKYKAVKEFAEELFKKFAGHSDYHGDTILAKIVCMAEGKNTVEAEPLDVSKIKTRAIKKFAEKLKKIYAAHDGLSIIIDQLIEEMGCNDG